MACRESYATTCRRYSAGDLKEEGLPTGVGSPRTNCRSFGDGTAAPLEVCLIIPESFPPYSLSGPEGSKAANQR